MAHSQTEAKHETNSSDSRDFGGGYEATYCVLWCGLCPPDLHSSTCGRLTTAKCIHVILGVAKVSCAGDDGSGGPLVDYGREHVWISWGSIDGNGSSWSPPKLISPSFLDLCAHEPSPPPPQIMFLVCDEGTIYLYFFQPNLVIFTSPSNHFLMRHGQLTSQNL